MKAKKLLASLMATAMLLPLSAVLSADEKADDSDKDTSAEETADAEETDEDLDDVEDKVWIEPKDLGGITLRFANMGKGSELNPDAKDIKDHEREERKARLEKLEKEWNVKVEFPDPPNVEWGKVPEALSKAQAAGKPVADIFDLSRTYVPYLVRNKAIADLTDVLKDHQLNQRYIETTTLAGRIYGATPYIGGEGLYYNRKMISDAGMEKTPSEMFREGKWSYKDFVAYLEELANKLPEGTKPFYIDPYYWLIFAPSANGAELIDTDGRVHYNDPAVVDALELLVTLNEKGLLMEPLKDENGDSDYWSTPQKTFEMGTGVAMCHRASWQAAGLVDKVDFGFVPYPWGPNVTVGETGKEDSYLSLSDNYHASAYDGASFVMRAGIEELGNPADIFDFLLVASRQDYMRREYLEKEGLVEPEEKEYDPHFFSDELDVELYDWSISKERFEPYPSLAGRLSLAKEYYDVLEGKTSVRAAAEALVNKDNAELDKVYGRAEDKPSPEEKEEKETDAESEDAESTEDGQSSSDSE